ncbi:Myb-like DNA-binding domain [Forsythia ovata]|uniref:Myb-like DNA-binding domain n=1 Tax=Forsythia ovata TaxID=205694 RepID=A0ABD1TAW8_9LAMI
MEDEGERKAVEAALNQKRLKEKDKKLLRKEMTHLQTLSSPILSQHRVDLTNNNVESFFMSLDMEQLQNLCDKMKEEERLERYEVLGKVLRFDHKLKDEKKDKKNLQSNGSVVTNGQDIFSGHEKREKPSSKEEIELLRKGMQKYPKGTSQR